MVAVDFLFKVADFNNYSTVLCLSNCWALLL